MTNYNKSMSSAIALDYIPVNYGRIKIVGDLCGLLNTDFEPKANIVMLPRRLKGDFSLLANMMATEFELIYDTYCNLCRGSQVGFPAN